MIAGDGPAKASLQKIAGPTITFLGYQSKEKLKELYTNALATIFPGDEDFGLVPIESLSCGTPVIAFKSGGALESIQEEKTGMFFDEPTSDALAASLRTFLTIKDSFLPENCKESAKKYSRKKFEEQILNHTKNLT